MAKKLYVENKDSAHCKECGQKCIPECDDGSFDFEFGSIKGTHSDGEEWKSSCHSAEIVEEDGREWTPEIVDGSPEP